MKKGPTSPGRAHADRVRSDDVEALLRRRGMSGVPVRTPDYGAAAGMVVQNGDRIRARCPIAEHRRTNQPSGAVRGVEPFAILKSEK